MTNSGDTRFWIEKQRRAVMLVSVLICMALAMTLFAGAVKTMTLEREQLRAQEIRLQTEFLADAGLQRAAARLRTAADYAGETWRIDPKTLLSRHEAKVEIHVETVAGRPLARLVKTTAEFPQSGPLQARRAKEIIINIKKTGESP